MNIFADSIVLNNVHYSISDLVILGVIVLLFVAAAVHLAVTSYQDIKHERAIKAIREARLAAAQKAVYAEAVDKVHAVFATNVAEAADKAYALFLEETDPMMQAFNTLAQDC